MKRNNIKKRKIYGNLLRTREKRGKFHLDEENSITHREVEEDERTDETVHGRTEMEVKPGIKNNSGDDGSGDDDVLDEDADDNEDGDADEDGEEDDDDDDEIDDGCEELSRYQYRLIHRLDPHHEDYESGDLCESDEDGEEEEEMADIDFGTGEDWDDRPTFNEFYGMED